MSWVWIGSKDESIAPNDILISPFREAKVYNNQDPKDMKSKVDLEIEAIKLNHENKWMLRVLNTLAM